MKKHLTCSGIALLLCLSAQADENPIYELPALVVQGKQNYAYQTNIKTGNETIIHADEITQTGVSQLKSLVSNISGLQFQSGLSENPSFNLRGFGENPSANALILVDGQPINKFDLSTPNINAIPLYDIEEVGIMPGSAGVLYGNHAVGGVFKIKTKMPKKKTIRLSTLFGLPYQNIINVFAGNAFKNGYRGLVNFAYDKSNGYRDFSTRKTFNFRGKLAKTLPQGEIKLGLGYGQTHADFPGSLTKAQVNQNRRQTGFKSQFDTEFWHSTLEFEHQLSKNWLFQTLSRFDQQWGQYTDQFITQYRPQNYRQFHLNPNATGQLNLIGKATKLTLGSDYDYDVYYANFGSSSSLNHRTTQNALSLYGLSEVSLTSKLDFLAGIRQANVWLNEAAHHFDASHHLWVSSFGLKYKITPTLTTYIRRAGNYRLPLADDYVAPNRFVRTNNFDLKPQTGVSYEAGINWKIAYFQLSAQAYWMRINNEIAFAPVEGNPTLMTNTNLPPTDRQGLILSAQAQPEATLTLRGSLTLMHNKFASGQNEGKEIPATASFLSQVSAHYQFKPNWSAFIEGLYTGDMFAASDFSNLGEKEPGYGLINIALNYQIKHWQVTLGLNNLLNTQYNSYTQFITSTQNAFYPAVGINGTLSIHYQF